MIQPPPWKNRTIGTATFERSLGVYTLTGIEPSGPSMRVSVASASDLARPSHCPYDLPQPFPRALNGLHRVRTDARFLEAQGHAPDLSVRGHTVVSAPLLY